MVKVAVVYHSGYGHTEKQAEKVFEGANSVDGAEAALIKVEDVTEEPTKLNEYDAIIFGAPTYMGSASAPMKAFMDATAKLWYTRDWDKKIAGGFTNSHSLSGNKANTLGQMITFAMQQGMIWVSLGQMNASPDGAAGKPDVLNRMGAFSGAMAQSDNLDPSVTPPEGDLESARQYGVRIAEVTKKYLG